MSRVDLHLHSRYSDRPAEWVLRRIGCRQSYTDTEELYRKLSEAGMTWKTITDHDRIDGCLEMRERHPDVFVSEEVTTFFPDGCEIHLLVWNIREADHSCIQELAPSIEELAAFLRAKSIPHAVAHPLENLNGKFSPDHFEKLILLFRAFETADGSRPGLPQEIARLCLLALTPERIREMAQRQGIVPFDSECHRKIFVAGSNDHGGLSLGSLWTEVDDDGSIDGFFRRLFSGEGKTGGGEPGDPARVSLAFYNLGLQYAQERLRQSAPLAAALVQKIAERFVSGKNPTAFSFGERIGHLAEAVRSGQVFELLKPGEGTLVRSFAEFFTNAEVREEIDRIILRASVPADASFRVASYLVNQLVYRLVRGAVAQLGRGSVLEAFQSLAGLLPVTAAAAPHLLAFRRQCLDRGFLRDLSRRYLATPPPEILACKRAWFTDTLDEVNGVTRTIQAMARAASEAGVDLTVVTSRTNPRVDGTLFRNFPPIGEFAIPEYELQKLSFPPFFDLLEFVHKERFTELIVSTPGPVGLSALAIGKVLGLRTVGIYHTDFPQYTRFLSQDPWMEGLAWSYMDWFYGQMAKTYVNSSAYLRSWRKRGLPEEKLAILPRGIEVQAFHPSFRRADFWKRRGATAPVLLYVGRISKEKELGFLPTVSELLRSRGFQFTLAFVGDGPYLPELKQILPEALFTGVLTGRELSEAYASADVFLFPSTTDTFGNAVLEAMASGVPVVVSDAGGPPELLGQFGMGRACRAGSREEWADAIAHFLIAPPSRAEREREAEAIRRAWNWERAFARFWESIGSPV
ncbi:GDP-mannose-dependent alpha-mannosyltransferase [Methylacidimicrobium cyclopophantes]|uniref:GDP-mannose-dependent alpha-mannosyltransferase n=1 Tax=Methylacidimicrobium cyclopophantes TaxID=1041766 RepID=A0A5E6MG70_9BACT|nr:glycosyltransferase [Methylacidimicrobium cyclopophantes]VVM08280.1 GDP-mannose-dependent alpha-mannosyltransferase [Methylacidimicrobium cyclopophantes]